MGWFLALYSLVVTAGNFAVVRDWCIGQRRSSLVPLVGGFAGAGACLNLPYPALHAWWWVPLLVDVGCGPYMLAIGTCSIVWSAAHGSPHSC